MTKHARYSRNDPNRRTSDPNPIRDSTLDPPSTPTSTAACTELDALLLRVLADEHERDEQRQSERQRRQVDPAEDRAPERVTEPRRLRRPVAGRTVRRAARRRAAPAAPPIANTTYVSRQPYRSISAADSGDITIVPTPMPATASPTADGAIAATNHPPTVATIGTYPHAAAIPTPAPYVT